MAAADSVGVILGLVKLLLFFKLSKSEGTDFFNWLINIGNNLLPIFLVKKRKPVEVL